MNDERIGKTLFEAETALSTSAIKTATWPIKKAQNAISVSRKLITDLGWTVVVEYTADKLAEDTCSNDEKRSTEQQREDAKWRIEDPEQQRKPYTKRS